MRKIPVAMCIGLLLTAFFLPMQSVNAEHQSLFTREVQEAYEEFFPAEPYEPVNLCPVSKIRDNEQGVYSDQFDAPLMNIIDDNEDTYFSQSWSSGRWIDIRFPGARKWLNFIEIQYSGENDFEFEIFDFIGERQSLDIISSEVLEIAGGKRIRTIEFEPVTAKGIRWLWTASDDKGIEIYEISAWFYQPDPDDMRQDPDVNDPTNWFLVETGDPIIGPPDIGPIWARITSRPGWCPAAAHWCHRWIPWADWSGDFRRAVAGGGENSHAWAWTGMDYHDFSVIACHGRPCRIRFSTGPPWALRDLVPPGDIFHSWGNRDAEWFCALSCSPYAWPNCPWRWAQGFDGLHLQCGFITSARATGGAFLGGFAWLMTNGIFNFPVSTSWFLARVVWQGPGVCAISLADDWRAYLDHLWGYGYVSPDPVFPRGLVWAIWDPPFDEGESRNSELPAALTPEQMASIAEISEGPDSKTIPAGSSTGIPIKTTEGLYNSKLRVDMTVYDLWPPNFLDSAYINDLADEFCINYGFFCSPAIEQDDEGNWWASEDEYAIWGDPVNGIIQFVNVDDFVQRRETEPSLPTPSSAEAEAEYLLANLGLSPIGSYVTEFTYNVQTVYDMDGETIVPDSSFDLSVNVDFVRSVDGYPVFGPGGYITVTVGEGSQVQHFTHGAWHDLINPRLEPVIDVSEAIDVLANVGEIGTIGGIPPICDTFIIESSQLAYYNTNGEYETDILEPIYVFTGYAMSDDEGIVTDVYVPALYTPPYGQIVDPPDSSTYAEGEEITFMATADGGAPPYTYEWYLNYDELLGTGSTLVVNDLPVSNKDTVQMAHLISVHVIDTNNKKAAPIISVFIESTNCCDMPGDANDNGMVNIIDITYLIGYLYQGGPPPPCMYEGDANGDCTVNILDITYVISYLYMMGVPPVCAEDCPGW